MSVCPITGDTDSDHLAKVSSAGSLHYKVTVPSFIIYSL